MINVLIMTDLEGISCVDRIEMMDRNLPDYHEACMRLMLDLNAALEGSFEGGANKVYVYDGHGGGNNFLSDLLHPQAIWTKGRQWRDLIISGEIQAYMFVGAHAKAGTINGFLDHTQNSRQWFDYVVNGRSCGEIGQSAIFAGSFNTPFVMVSGDLAACVEAKEFLGDIPTAAVKEGIGRNRARCLPSDEALDLIRKAAKEGVKRHKEIPIYRVFLPLEISLTLYRTDFCDSLFERNKGVERIDARTVRKQVNKVVDYMDILF